MIANSYRNSREQYQETWNQILTPLRFQDFLQLKNAQLARRGFLYYSIIIIIKWTTVQNWMHRESLA